MNHLSEQQIYEVIEIVNQLFKQLIKQHDAEKEKMYDDVCAEMKIDDSNFKKELYMESTLYKYVFTNAV